MGRNEVKEGQGDDHWEDTPTICLGIPVSTIPSSSSKAGTVCFSNPVNNRTPLFCEEHLLGSGSQGAISSLSKSMSQSHTFIHKPVPNSPSLSKADTPEQWLAPRWRCLRSHEATRGRVKVSRPSPLSVPCLILLHLIIFIKKKRNGKWKCQPGRRAGLLHLTRALASSHESVGQSTLAGGKARSWIYQSSPQRQARQKQGPENQHSALEKPGHHTRQF